MNRLTFLWPTIHFYSYIDVLCFDQVDKCLESLIADEFILRTQSEEGSSSYDLLTPTQLGNAVFASSMNPDESLTILCDLNKARKQFVLENELHMVYQVCDIYLHRRLRHISMR